MSKPSPIIDLLRDVIFVSAVLMKGRYITSLRPSSMAEFEAFVKGRLSKGLYLVSSTAGSKTFRALVLNGSVLGALMEESGSVAEGEEALRKCLDGGLGLNVFEITEDVLNFVPGLRERLEKLSIVEESGAKIIPPTAPRASTPTVVEKPLPTPPSVTAPPREERVERRIPEAAMPRAVDLKSALAMIENELPHTMRVIGIDMGKVVARMTEGNTISLYVKVINIPPPELDSQKICWISLSKVVTTVGRPVNDFDYYIEIETPHQGAAIYQFLSPLDKVQAFVNGTVLYQLYTHGITATSIKSRFDPSSNFLEVIYSVKPRSREVALSTYILERIARECLRIVKIGFRGRARIRLRAGLFTEGRAEG